MLPRRFHLRPGAPFEGPDQSPDLFAQVTIALFAVLALALAIALTTEGLALLTPSDALALAP